MNLADIKDGDTITIYTIKRDGKVRKVNGVASRHDDVWTDGRLTVQTSYKDRYYIGCKYATAWLTFREAQVESMRQLRNHIALHQSNLMTAKAKLIEVQRQQEE